MQNPITKIKSFVENHADEIIVGATVGAISAAAYVTGIAVQKYVIQANDVIIPAALVDYLKNIDGGVLGVDVVKGYDVLVKLIPVTE